MEAVGNLTAGIAHNFNNMLAAILPTLELLRRTASAEERRFIDDATQAAERAADMVRHLLTFSGQRRATEFTPTDASIIVRRAVAMCRGSFDRNIAVEQQLESGVGAVICDDVAVEQVLVNLILNARDAVIESGKPEPRIAVSVTAATAASRNGRRGNFVCFRVSDNGTGIANAMKDRMFEPFATTKPTGRGTGLGLAVSYAMINDHGGWMEFETEAAVGTTFSVFLPAAPAGTSTAVRSPNATPVQQPRPLRVLVVDDDRPVRNVTERLLRGAAHDVLTASGVTTARAVLERSREIDLVLLDYSMPDGPGSVIVNDIRRLQPWCSIVYLTGQTLPPEERARVDEVLYKPLSRATLLESVARVTRR
jgi:CheY-like chemotaxis protein